MESNDAQLVEHCKNLPERWWLAMKKPIQERVNEYVKKHPEAYDLTMSDVNEIRRIKDTLDAVCIAFAYGYMKGSRVKK